MTAVKTIAIGAAGLAVLVGGAAPAAAQYYPGNPQGYGQLGPVNPYGGQYGYGYGMNQHAVQQCTAAVQHRLQLQYRAGYGGYGYGPYGYNNPYSGARVLGITRIEPRSRSTLRVRGVATSGIAHGGYPYGRYGGYGGGYAQAPADLTFRCDIDYRGRIRDIDIDRR